MDDLSIGDVARAAEVSVDTIRFYERRGLLRRAARTRGNYRRFGPATVERVRLIRGLAALSLELDEIRALLGALESPAGSCESERPRLLEALSRTEARITVLAEARDRLRSAIASCPDACELPERVRNSVG